MLAQLKSSHIYTHSSSNKLVYKIKNRTKSYIKIYKLSVLSYLLYTIFNYFIELIADVNGGTTCFFLDNTPGKNAILS